MRGAKGWCLKWDAKNYFKRLTRREILTWILIYLKRVLITRVLKQAILRIKHFTWQQMQPIALVNSSSSRNFTISRLKGNSNYCKIPIADPSNSLFHVLRSHFHHQPIALFKYFWPWHLQSTVTRLWLKYSEAFRKDPVDIFAIRSRKDQSVGFELCFWFSFVAVT